VRRDRRLADMVPFVAILFLFANFVHAGAGFAWRYEGDFWPYILLACVQYIHRLPRGANVVLGWPLALVCTGASAIGYYGHVENALSTLEVVDEASEKTMWDDFTNSRYEGDPTLPSRITCGDTLTTPLNNGLGWYTGCSVDTFTNVYLGVPAKRTDQYELKIDVNGNGPQTLTIFCNGRNYVAQRQGDAYRAFVSIHYPWLVSPVVQTVVEWTKDVESQSGLRMLRIELI
jgi:hypothetical protein